MIIVKLSGNLSRQLGQYACGRAAAARLGCILKLDADPARPALADYFVLAEHSASAAEVAAAKACGSVTEDSLLFEPGFWQRLRDGIYLDGNWHDFGYADAALPQLVTALRLRSVPDGAAVAALSHIQRPGSCAAALDLRRAAPPYGLAELPLSYYQDALAALCYRLPQAHVFVLCDEAAQAARLDFPCPHTVLVAADAAVALLLMAACAHHIVSYNGAACWAARLAPKPGQLVIAPQQAFDPADSALLARFGAVEQPRWPAAWQVLPIRAPQAPEARYLQAAGGHNPGRPIRVALWNYYEELSTDGFIFRNANAAIGADLLKPWVALHAYGQAHGIEFVTYDQVSGVDQLDAVLFIDRPRRGNPALEALMAADIAKYLLLYECEVIKPDNWETPYHQQFQRVFTWNDSLVDGERYVKINFAIDTEGCYDLATQQSAFGQRKLATMIAGAKQSSHPKELYSHRLRTIRWFESGAPADFDLYGGGWDAAQFPSYRGKVGDKLATLAAYRFAICYENAGDIPGYITEKILDCLRAGTVPVYGGAPNIARWIPADCYIDIGRFGTYDELHAHLKGMDAATHAGYLARMQAFLASPQAYPFSIECFVATVSGCIAWDVQSRRGETPELAQREGAAAGARLVQDGTTLALRPDSAPRAAAAPRPGLVVYIGYGDELPVYARARSLWQFYRSFFPDIDIIFVRETEDVARGQVVTEGDDLLVGLGSERYRGAASYASTGTWSATENAKVIFRQMVVYDHLLRTRDKPFFLYHTTVTSVVDLRALQALLADLPASGCFAGPLSRLTGPEALNGWTFVSGASTLLSSDVVALLRNRYDPDHPNASLPNDVWQALTLHDVERTALPTFNFIRPRAPGAQIDAVSATARAMLANGQFHFRIKTTSAEEGLAKREDVDPWIMLKIMQEIIAHQAPLETTRELCGKYARFVEGGTGRPMPPYTRGDFFSGPRTFPINDQETS